MPTAYASYSVMALIAGTLFLMSGAACVAQTLEIPSTRASSEVQGSSRSDDPHSNDSEDAQGDNGDNANGAPNEATCQDDERTTNLADASRKDTGTSDDSGDDQSAANDPGISDDDSNPSCAADENQSETASVPRRPRDRRGSENDNLANEVQPYVDKSYTSYADSERFKTVTMTSNYNFTLLDNEMSIRRDTVTASDRGGTQEFNSDVLTIHHDLTEQLSLSGGFGQAQSRARADYIGSIKGEANLFGWSLEQGVAHDLLATTADEIRHNLRQTDYALTASGTLFAGLTGSIELHRRSYSDGNSAKEFEVTPQYAFAFAGGKAILGYDLDFQDFARESLYYWTPRGLLAQNASLSWRIVKEDVYANLMASAGRSTAKASTGTVGGPSSGYNAATSGALGFHYAHDSFAELFWNINESAKWSSQSFGFRVGYGLE